ncbi:DUF4262 domain-containing protein [Shewanella corallii]|uniref:DUF4262 domain-containing protein n=1 Tax=Shewanella corallii TaxID=560080 RepID=A0ABT0N6K2_9GAMM|nr:DUF4262 domain-containing protein [Shewanella corallii]
MDKQDRQALDNIKKFGCHVLKVMEGDGQPEFTYSIGINRKQNKPDLIIIGLNNDLSHSIVNNYKDRLLNGETFEPGQFYSDFIAGYDVCFIEVDKTHYKEYLGWGLWLHNGDNFKVLQLIWPTTSGLWPWDDEKSEFYVWAQPILNSSGALSKI